MVSRAFQVLSDPDKKSKFDRFGGDPDSRFQSAASSGASPFSGFAQQRGAGRAGPMFEEEISPEELFRQFFGGGMGGGGFGGPFGGFGKSLDDIGAEWHIEVLTTSSRRPRWLRLQRGRRARRARTSIRRQQPSTKTSQPRERGPTITACSDTIPITTPHPVHPPTPELPVLRQRHNMAFSPLRQPFTSPNTAPHLEPLERQLLRQPERSNRVLNTEMERSGRACGRTIRAASQLRVRMGTESATTSFPGRTGILQTR